ncbi:hypothetical protein F2Q69_00059026 [Brassica cretica]|uniref:Uncharacterized protein n=1 Tax=Brassica cretica TaxID=69181 RepID=A0A8S9RMS0_BRACR|nr:hypothetical protein F2Q69_00059026 [Brassica cretica]
MRRVPWSCVGFWRSDSRMRSLITSLLEKHVDLRGSTSSVVNLRFHCFHFRSRLRDVITEVTDFVEIIASSFPISSTFAVSDMGLFFGEFLLFGPEGVFLFLCHGFLERRIFLIHMASSPPWMHVCILVRMIGLIAGIQVDSFDFIILRFPHGRWKVFQNFPSHGRGNLNKVFSYRVIISVPRPVEWSLEIKSPSVKLCSSVGKDGSGGEHLLERCGVSISVDRGYVRCWSRANVVVVVDISINASLLAVCCHVYLSVCG